MQTNLQDIIVVPNFHLLIHYIADVRDMQISEKIQNLKAKLEIGILGAR